MSSRHKNGKSTSAGSSPRKIIGVDGKNATSLVVTPISSRPGCSTQSALQSSWIQRIIPLSHTCPEDVQEPLCLDTKLSRKKRELDFNATDGHVVESARPMDMDCTEERDEEADTMPVNDPSSWLTVRDSVQDEKPSCNGSPSKPIAGRNSEAQFVFGSQGLSLKPESPANHTEHRARISASSDSKVVFVENIPGRCSQQNINPEKQSPSAWLTNKHGDAGCKLESKAAAEDNKKAICIFPPLKSGEQWPGTLKPSGLPHLRIPSSSEHGCDVGIHRLPCKDSVSVQRKDKYGRDVAPFMQSVSLFDTLDDRRQGSDSSFTRSLPSSFVADLYDKNRKCDRIKSLQETYGLVEGNVRRSDNASSRSDTKSLFEDDETTDADSADAVKGKRIKDTIFLCGTSNSSGGPKEPHNTHNNLNFHDPSLAGHEPVGRSPDQYSRQHFSLPRPPCSSDQQKLKAPVSAAHVQQTDKAASRSLRSRGSQQWLQRWSSQLARDVE